MVKIVHAQTVILDEWLDQLKQKTHRENTKDALSDAIVHMLKCKEPALREALREARQYIAVRCMGSANADGDKILKQIDEVLK